MNVAFFVGQTRRATLTCQVEPHNPPRWVVRADETTPDAAVDVVTDQDGMGATITGETEGKLTLLVRMQVSRGITLTASANVTVLPAEGVSLDLQFS